MALHTRRSLVTDTGNDEDGHSRPDRPDVYTRRALPRFSAARNLNSSFSVASHDLVLAGRTCETVLPTSNSHEIRGDLAVAVGDRHCSPSSASRSLPPELARSSVTGFSLSLSLSLSLSSDNEHRSETESKLAVGLAGRGGWS